VNRVYTIAQAQAYMGTKSNTGGTVQGKRILNLKWAKLFKTSCFPASIASHAKKVHVAHSRNLNWRLKTQKQSTMASFLRLFLKEILPLEYGSSPCYLIVWMTNKHLHPKQNTIPCVKDELLCPSKNDTNEHRHRLQANLQEPGGLRRL